jgi:HD-GYP domain-containing protein (c-di-GMP phosphodiesterase class II)
MSDPLLLRRIEKLVDIGIALSVEQDSGRLMESILLGAKAITNADGGTLYSVGDDGKVRMEIIRTDSLDYAMGGTTGKKVPFPPIPLYDDQGRANERMVVTYAVHRDEIVNIPDAYDAVGFDFSGTREFDLRTGYRSTSFLTVPMKNHEGDVIGVLQLLNARDERTNEVIPFSSAAERLARALAAQAAVALSNKRLVAEMENLFNSFVHLIADTIDEKSPYTGDHCRRVPVLTMMLAEAVHRTDEGPFADFRMSEADRYELEVAGWLHDCGKLTTPEYIMDKATKLSTIFDRIALVDTRFEVLRRDAEIAMLRRRLAELEDIQADELSDAVYEHECRTLEEEREFLRRSNLGGEFMSPADQDRVRAIGRRRWTGPRGRSEPLLTDEEIANLCIPRGTLTPAERQIVNDHIVATIAMLEKLPFPKHLRNVPEYAGGHHERVDGRGYPRGLTGEQMSVQARVMAIADVFEALTARDRPYKRGKKLSETLAILAGMSEDGHIDPELFRIFVKEKVYLEYARAYLEPEQVDPINEDDLLAQRELVKTRR